VESSWDSSVGAMFPAISMLEAFIVIWIADSATEEACLVGPVFFVTATRVGTDLGLLLSWLAAFLRASSLQAS